MQVRWLNNWVFIPFACLLFFIIIIIIIIIILNFNVAFTCVWDPIQVGW